MRKYMMFLGLFLLSSVSMSADFVEGKDYEVLKAGNELAYTGGPVTVAEFFSYGCPWCFRLEGSLSQWVMKQGSAIDFSKVPVVFNKNWEYYARAYYIIQSLSLSQTVSHDLFKAIIDDKEPLYNDKAMVLFFMRHGVKSSITDSALAHSPSIELKLKADQALMAQYQINVIPNIVIQARYKTNLQMAKTEAHLFEVLDYLVAKVKKPVM